jgi:hypothetical protein
MTESATSGDSRKRGSVRARGTSLQVRVYAGVDPVTDKPTYLTETIKGTDKATHRLANKAMTKLQARVDEQRSPSTSVTLSYAIDEWLRTADIEDTTRHGYVGYIERAIRPALGDVPVGKLTTRMLETFYGELRRCRTKCNGRPFVEHIADGEHDCKKLKCKLHVCKGMASSTVRQIHSIISGVLNAAVRWDWIGSNPARIAQRPKQTPPQPDPPSSTQAALLVNKAFDLDEDWGTLVWLVMTTGILLDLGENALAVELLTSTRAHAARNTDSLLRAWLAAAHGEALAADGQRSASLRASIRLPRCSRARCPALTDRISCLTQFISRGGAGTRSRGSANRRRRKCCLRRLADSTRPSPEPRLHYESTWQRPSLRRASMTKCGCIWFALKGWLVRSARFASCAG